MNPNDDFRDKYIDSLIKQGKSDDEIRTLLRRYDADVQGAPKGGILAQTGKAIATGVDQFSGGLLDEALGVEAG